jgi:hypothetical protein
MRILKIDGSRQYKLPMRVLSRQISSYPWSTVKVGLPRYSTVVSYLWHKIDQVRTDHAEIKLVQLTKSSESQNASAFSALNLRAQSQKPRGQLGTTYLTTHCGISGHLSETKPTSHNVQSTRGCTLAAPGRDVTLWV